MRTFSAMVVAAAVMVGGAAFAGSPSSPSAVVADASKSATVRADSESSDASRLVASKTQGVGVVQLKTSIATTTVRVRATQQTSERVYWRIR